MSAYVCKVNYVSSVSTRLTHNVLTITCNIITLLCSPDEIEINTSRELIIIVRINRYRCATGSCKTICLFYSHPERT